MSSKKCSNQQPTTTFHKTKTTLAKAVSLAFMTSGAVHAQTLEEIVVTATKRGESVQDVPLAITAFSGDFSRNVNLDDVKDLITFTPGVTGNSKDSFIDAVSIRGVRTQDFGVGGDPSAAFFKNDLYEGRNGVVVTSLYDVDRSEVLRGPQGFLFGRNAIGGAFSVHTKKAEVNGGNVGYVELDVAERGHVVGEGAINVPINENFAMRFAGYYSTEDGYVENTQGGPDLIGHDKGAIRWSTTYETDKLQVQTLAEYEERDQSGTVYRAIQDDRLAAIEAAVGTSFVVPADARDASSDLFNPRDDAEILTLGLHVEYDLGWANFESNTGYKDHDYFYTEDYDGTNLSLGNYKQDQSGNYFQQELRLVSQGEGPLSWYGGVSYYKEEIDVMFQNTASEEAFCAYYGAYYGLTNCNDYVGYWAAYYGIPYFTPSSNGLLDETSRAVGDFYGWAAYLDVNYEFNDQWDLGVGVRYTYDEKEFSNTVFPVESALGSYFLYGFTTNGAISDTQDWDDVTPRAILRYRPNDDSLIYASITKGFKSGGFGTFSAVNINNPGEDTFQWYGDGADAPFTQAGGYRPGSFRPETVWSYEVGYKGSLFDDRANLNILGFLYDYEDLQVNFFDQGARVGNTREAEGKGIEMSLTAALGDNFDLYFSAGWLDTEAFGLDFVCETAGACEGSSLFWAPDISGALALSASFPKGNGEFIGNFEIFWESERGRGYDNIATSENDAYADMTIRFGYRSNDNWSVTGYVENVTDELYFDGSANNGAIAPGFFFGPSRPRTAGVRFSYEWE